MRKREFINWQALSAVFQDSYTLRRVRAACGCIMLSYLMLHLINHSLGNISLDAMTWGSRVHEAIWHSTVGTIALYGAFLVHFSLALWALYQRRSFRMGFGESVRLILGFCIVPLLAHHYAAGRWVYSALDIDRRFDGTLLIYFIVRPFFGERQVLVLIVAWIHGCLGLHFWLRDRPGYQQLKPLLLAFAVLLPSTALLGIAQGAREVANESGAWKRAVVAQGRLGDLAIRERSWEIELAIYLVWAGALGAVLAARGMRSVFDLRRGTVRITYPNGMVVQIPKGLAVLDASRRARIPHASICGGRARCATCRIRVLRGFEHLPQAAPHEVAVLSRFQAARTVRLACQVRPTEDTAVLPLLPPDVAFDDRRRQTSGTADAEQFVAVMFIDIRQSTALVEKRLPYDVIFLLNHFFEAVGGAVAAVGGAPNQFLGDGMMAIFGMDCDAREACRRALAAAAPIFHRLAEMNRTLSDDLPQPISIGLGLHAGTAILGELGYKQHFILTAIGDTVHVAARLQELTKEFACQAVVSKAVLDTAGIEGAESLHREVRVRGRDAPLAVQIVSDVDHFESLVARTS